MSFRRFHRKPLRHLPLVNFSAVSVEIAQKSKANRCVSHRTRLIIYIVTRLFLLLGRRFSNFDKAIAKNLGLLHSYFNFFIICLIMINLCAREREIFGEMQGKERRTTIPCQATIPKYIVEKILSQGGTGSARPAGGRNWISATLLLGLVNREDKGASSVLFPLRLPARAGASYIRCEKPFSSASCVSVARHGTVVLRSYTWNQAKTSISRCQFALKGDNKWQSDIRFSLFG